MPGVAGTHRSRSARRPPIRRRDGLWLGFFRGGVAHFADGQIAGLVYSRRRARRGPGQRTSADPDADAVGRRRRRAQPAEKRPRRDAHQQQRTAVRQGRLGHRRCRRSLWLGMACGLVRIARAESTPGSHWQRMAAHASCQTNGVRSLRRSQTRRSIGELLHCAGRQVRGRKTVVRVAGRRQRRRPARLPFNTLPPPVHVEQIVADRKTLRRDVARAALRCSCRR